MPVMSRKYLLREINNIGSDGKIYIYRLNALVNMCYIL